jgi:hypothetical protein
MKKAFDSHDLETKERISVILKLVYTQNKLINNHNIEFQKHEEKVERFLAEKKSLNMKIEELEQKIASLVKENKSVRIEIFVYQLLCNLIIKDKLFIFKQKMELETLNDGYEKLSETIQTYKSLDTIEYKSSLRVLFEEIQYCVKNLSDLINAAIKDMKIGQDFLSSSVSILTEGWYFLKKHSVKYSFS